MSALEFHKGKSWHFCGDGCQSKENGPRMSQVLVTVMGRPINGKPSNSHLCPGCVKVTKEAWDGAVTSDVEPMGVAA